MPVPDVSTSSSGATKDAEDHPGVLVCSKSGDYVRHHLVQELAGLLGPADLLVVNVATLGLGIAADSRAATVQPPWALGPGSHEPVTAGVAFDSELLARLHQAGTRWAPVILNTAAAGEQGRPGTEWYSVSGFTASLIAQATAADGRVIAVGTSALRAIEATVGTGPTVRPGRGWTNIEIDFERPPKVIDALITGLHTPGSVHRSAVAAITSWQLLFRAYDHAAHLGHYPGHSDLLHLALP